MRHTKIVVIGASAGGIEALNELVRGLRPDFGAPILLVLHIPADSPSLLAKILARAGTVKTKTADDGERAENGTLYVAPPDRHLLVEADGTLRTPRGPRENRHRPSVDPLFRSAALGYGPHAIGVILSGTLDDGTAGLLAIQRRGGITIVQDPDDAAYPGMPMSAIANVDVDHVLPMHDIAAQLALSLTREPRGAAHIDEEVPQMELEKQIAGMDEKAMRGDDRPGQPSAFSCPDCGGVLWEIEDGEFVRFRCRVGHAYSPETMLAAQGDVLEEALWAAMKTLEESARLSKRLAAGERDRGHEWMAQRFDQKEMEARDRADVIRRFLASDDSTVPLAG
ncbi:MAG: two-component system, chemotaxis family, protein-glutamate methylesterase/glutaminase, partial [Thermoanaerobaculia bacterium]|nr:two-component system, chemotaxis family, protein-glutamate methylesterase/glutaminase [Thermoanaerobaculia bacterium]